MSRTVLAGVMFVLYMLNTVVLKQSGYIVGFFLSYAWIYFMGGAVRKHLFEIIKNSELLMSVKGIVLIAVVSVGYMMLAFVSIYKSQSWSLATAVTVIGVFLLFVIAVQIEHYHCGEKLWMVLGDYGMDIYMIGYMCSRRFLLYAAKF